MKPLKPEPRPINIGIADIDSRLLRYFLAVVREGSIRKAADTQNVAASAISRQISDLELRLGLPLLERLPRGVVPTEAGRAIAEHAMQQFEDGERLIDYLKQLHGLRQGAVRIACGEGFVGDLVENGLRPFSESYPHIRLQIRLGGTADILQSVADGESDVGLAYNPTAHPGLHSVSISRQPLCILSAPEHSFQPGIATALRDVASQPAALLTPSHGIRQLLSRIEADHGFHLTAKVEAASIEIVRRLARFGGLVTFLPEFAAAAEIASGHLVVTKLTDPLLAEATAHLVVRSRRRLPGAVEGLVAHLTSNMRAFV